MWKHGLTPIFYPHTDTDFRSPPRTHSATDHLINLFIYLFIPWSRFLLEKPSGSQLVEKFPPFYGTGRFIILYYIVLYCVILYCIISYITSYIIYHIISYIISCHIISYHIISYIIYHIIYHIIYNISYHIIYHIVSYRIVSYRVVSCRIVLYHISYHISYHIILYYYIIMTSEHEVLAMTHWSKTHKRRLMENRKCGEHCSASCYAKSCQMNWRPRII